MGSFYIFLAMYGILVFPGLVARAGMGCWDAMGSAGSAPGSCD